MVITLGYPVRCHRLYCRNAVVGAAPPWQNKTLPRVIMMLVLSLSFVASSYFACQHRSNTPKRGNGCVCAGPTTSGGHPIGDNFGNASVTIFSSHQQPTTIAFGIVRTALAARPQNCAGATFTAAQTVTFDPSEPGPYTVDLSGCANKAGLTIDGAPAGQPLIGVTVAVSAISGTFLTVAASLNFSTGSALLIDGAALTGAVTIAASAHNSGAVRLANLKAASLTVAGGSLSAMGRPSLFLMGI